MFVIIIIIIHVPAVTCDMQSSPNRLTLCIWHDSLFFFPVCENFCCWSAGLKWLSLDIEDQTLGNTVFLYVLFKPAILLICFPGSTKVSLLGLAVVYCVWLMECRQYREAREISDQLLQLVLPRAMVLFQVFHLTCYR